MLHSLYMPTSLPLQPLTIAQDCIANLSRPLWQSGLCQQVWTCKPLLAHGKHLFYSNTQPRLCLISRTHSKGKMWKRIKVFLNKKEKLKPRDKRKSVKILVSTHPRVFRAQLCPSGHVCHGCSSCFCAAMAFSGSNRAHITAHWWKHLPSGPSRCISWPWLRHPEGRAHEASTGAALDQAALHVSLLLQSSQPTG